MSFRTRFTTLCNLLFSCLCFSEELSDEFDDQDSQVSCELPDLVIHEILMKLPVKSVVRCRHVCKAWYRVFSDPYFTDVYFKSSPFNVIAITQHWTYSNTDDRWSYEHFYCYIEVGRNGDITRNSLNLKASIPVKDKKLNGETLVGSCDGLLCLAETTKISVDSRSVRSSYVIPPTTVWIVNPLIGECKALPRVCELSGAYVVYGFGSTIDGDHYKVVKVAMTNLPRTAKAHILTIGVDKYWREIDISSMPLRFYSHGVILNGALHWLGDGHTLRGVLYAFDILTEKGQCFKLPCAVGRKTCDIYLGVRNGHLYITDSSTERQVEIWTMEQYGEAESWRRDVIISPNDIIPILSRVLVPITTMRNGNLLLSCRHYSKLLSCDPKATNCVKLKNIDTNRSFNFVSGYGYTPSFISPHDIMSMTLSIR